MTYKPGRLYFVIQVSDLTQSMIDLSIEDNAFSARYNNNETQVILKYEA